MAALPRLLRLLWVDSAGVLAELLTTALLSVLIYLCYRYSDRVSRLVGPTGTTIIVRLSAFLLFCIGVQVLWTGASELLASVGKT